MDPTTGTSIGEVARRTGVTERTLRYYEEEGLLTPARDPGGRRRYDAAQLDRLYRIRLLRELGTPVAEIAPDSADLPALTRRITLLVYRDLEAAHRFLVDVFGLLAGPLHRDDSGSVVHGEVGAGDGVVWLHPESERARLASPLSTGVASACLAVVVEDLDAHVARVHAAGVEVDYPPTVQPYGVREYGARDPEGHLWSFQQPLDEQEES